MTEVRPLSPRTERALLKIIAAFLVVLVVLMAIGVL